MWRTLDEPWQSVLERIKKLPENQWRGEVEKVGGGLAFPGHSQQTIKEKIIIELVLEHKRQRA
jgi:hypothetical protein